MEGGAMPPEVSAPSESNPQGEEQFLRIDLIVIRDDDGLERSFQRLSEDLIHHIYLDEARDPIPLRVHNMPNQYR
jgi:hypothetical protein